MYKVFLASTYDDLKHHRARVIGRLRDLGLGIDPMENWGADPREPKEFSKDRVLDCDLLVLLVAFRRGYVPENETLSITQMEYRAAKEAGMDVLVFQLAESDELKWYTRYDELSTDPEIGRWRAQLAADHGCSFFDDDPRSVDIEQAVMRWRSERLRQSKFGNVAATLSDRATGDDHTPDGRSRFVVRREYFGCLIYDRNHRDYLAFDHEATEIFERTLTKPYAEVATSISGWPSDEQMEMFGQLLQQAGILNKDGFCTGRFLSRPVPSEARLSAPIHVFLSCTAECNFNCIHCFSRSGAKRANELTTKEITALIDDMADSGCFKLSIGGGEPLLRPDLPTIIQHANARDVSVTLSTNAAIASHEIVDSLTGLKIDRIKVSIPAGTGGTANRIRAKPDALEDAKIGIDRLKRLNVPLVLHAVVMQANLGELDEMLSISEQVGVPKMAFTIMLPAGRAAEIPDEQLSPDMAQAFWSNLERKRDDEGREVGDGHALPMDKRHLFEGFGCDCGNVVCHIDPVGQVSASGPLQEMFSAGSIRRAPLSQIWSDVTHFAQIERARIEGNCSCNACTHFQGCRGGCRARGWLGSGGADAPDQLCHLV